jgi:PTH1 family peptidyl-tRNA hydrolase
MIVGLGNPGPEHEDDRHNAGFWFVEAVARAHGGSFSNETKFFGRVARARIGHEQVWLLEPTTYMNRSGLAVAALAGFYRIAPEQILVAHDELDLLPGQVKLKQGGGSAGHNGLKDITAHLGTQDYWRLRIGIGHPGDRNEVVNYVLKPPRREEQAEIDAAIERAVELMPLIEKGEWNAATQRANTKPASPKPQESP